MNHHNSRPEALGISIVSLRTCFVFCNGMVSRCGCKRRQGRDSENTKFSILTDLGTEAGPHGKDSSMDRRQKAGVGALHSPRLLLALTFTGKARRSWANSLGLASLNNLGGLGAIGCSLVT